MINSITYADSDIGQKLGAEIYFSLPYFVYL